MNVRLQGLLTFLDLLAEGQRRQAEVVTGRRFEAQAGIVPVQAGPLAKIPLTGRQKPHFFGLPREPRVDTRY